ncbi:LysM domain protein [Streptococcus infantarius subsp. infantarius]|jgi:LysM repeat protein|uniref:LysM repeat-containing protein n=2 Tax=Streptococcus infantarius TaxID=102684 RepID=A0A380KT16_9STRE|nr:MULTISPECIES: LysM domain-containing protein [Streptococcus]AEZ63231.1 LysM domain protein [Streptococcus infantarius subsp. infantarius CJ18]EDT48231.1 LysM domain protein [Streptococcus infantarius subsp. infantarius ATCC BAA-102]MBK8155366.1 LysM peptidoglycan-binding domain-containing protein [Streptococcus sp.]MBT0897213.1 LysM domain-containing protein [Streptococcus infantarius subsp. infantarius]MBT0900033.1 LysM domain-containing protein [Streptococcus infantarius subsp. infantariu
MQTNIFKTKSKSIKLGLAGVAAAAALIAPAVANADSYTVKSGDTLSKIAVTYNTTVEKLASTNQIANVDFITVGQILELDSEATAPAATTTETAAVEAAPAPATVAAAPAETTTTSYSSNLGTSDAQAKEIIAQRESSGSYTAQNGQYYGRYQLTMSYLNGDLSAENQERVADSYVAGRYGSWSAALAFWNANGWY